MNNIDTPDYQSADYISGAKLPTLWAMVDAALGGTYDMRQAGDAYLPQFPAEADEVYQDRLNTSTFDNDYRDTLDGITGMAFRKPAQLGENVPAQLAEHAEDIDLAGSHLDVFSTRFFAKGVHYGAAYILVDMQRTPEDEAGRALDDAEARALNLRPYWIAYTANQVQSRPRYVPIRGAQVLQQIVFRECVNIPDGAFGETEVIRYRVWRLPVMQDFAGRYSEAGDVQWEVWEEQIEDVGGKEQKNVVMIDSGSILGLDRIPVSPFIANPDRYDSLQCAGPTLADLAYLCVKDWQQASDHESNLHLCSSPIPYTVNLADDGALSKQPWGKGVRYDCTEGGSVGYAEPAGTGLEAMERQLAKNKAAIKQKGLEMVIEGGDITQTATDALLRAAKRSSRLSSLVRAFQDCIELALAFHAQWLGLPEGGEITMGIKADELILTPQDVTAYSAAVLNHQISTFTFWGLLKRGGILSDDFNEAEEARRIADERKAKMDEAMAVAAARTPVREFQDAA